MDYINAASRNIMGGMAPYRVMCQAPGGADGLTMVCFAQHFAALHAGIATASVSQHPGLAVAA